MDPLWSRCVLLDALVWFAELATATVLLTGLGPGPELASPDVNGVTPQPVHASTASVNDVATTGAYFMAATCLPAMQNAAGLPYGGGRKI
ncbi:MAG: hypothetical protein K6T78_00550 [Alicyclobacillus sp.]|nr:hypothetical protein [Alicyclobacillus sp.]